MSFAARLYSEVTTSFTGLPVIDSTQTQVDDVVLVNGSSVNLNGLYIVKSGAWERTVSGFEVSDNVVNAIVTVTDGRYNKGIVFRNIRDPSIVGTNVKFAMGASDDTSAGDVKISECIRFMYNGALTNVMDATDNKLTITGTSSFTALSSTIMDVSALELSGVGAPSVGDVLTVTSVDGDYGKLGWAQSSGGWTGAGLSYVKLGNDATVTGANAIGIGYNCTASGSNSVSIGYQAEAKGTSDIAIGSNTEAYYGESIAIGDGAVASNKSVSIGTSASTASGGSSIALGVSATASGLGSIAIGNAAKAIHAGSIVISAMGSVPSLQSANTNSFYLAPIRQDSTVNANMTYHPLTGEITYSTTAASDSTSYVYSNLFHNIGSLTDKKFLSTFSTIIWNGATFYGDLTMNSDNRRFSTTTTGLYRIHLDITCYLGQTTAVAATYCRLYDVTNSASAKESSSSIPYLQNSSNTFAHLNMNGIVMLKSGVDYRFEAKSDNGGVINHSAGSTGFCVELVRAVAPLSHPITVTANGSSAYRFSGTDRSTGFLIDNTVDNPTIYVHRYDTVTFTTAIGGHPFYIKDNTSTGTANPLAGVTGQGATNGDVVWEVLQSVGVYYYICSAHPAMTGMIIVF